MHKSHVEIAVLGAGIAGIATAYYLCTRYNKRSVLLIDSAQPMSFTSAQSGDNYRNWWPHPVMTAFTDYSIDLMERIASESSNAINMSRRGYALATRAEDIADLIEQLHDGYAGAAADPVRIHATAKAAAYATPTAADWAHGLDGVDVLSHRDLIRATFPSFGKDIAHVLHVRRAGGFSSQVMGQWMLERIRAAGGQRLTATVTGVAQAAGFTIECAGPAGPANVHADVLVNAAGPYAGQVAAMLGVDLAIENVFQQKLAFEDVGAAIPRRMPFSIDLDTQTLDWTEQEKELLRDDPDLAWLARPIAGGVHCRPDGPEAGRWVKLGWAYNRQPGEPHRAWADEPRFDAQFPEIVMRGAAALNPALRQYLGSFPTRRAHYGGYYTMTPENWPLIGPLGMDGAFIVGALSGFGSMAACAAGALAAAWIAGGELPAFAPRLSRRRYADQALMTALATQKNKGLL